MSKKNTNKTKTTLAQRFNKPIPVHPLIAIVFILAFIGLGVYSIRQSSAAGWNCTYHDYYEYSQYGYCMRDAQRMLSASAGNYGGYGLAIDGNFGPNTEHDVIKLQQVTSRQYGVAVDGVIGPQTWKQICRYGNPVSWNAWADAGCARF